MKSNNTRWITLNALLFTGVLAFNEVGAQTGSANVPAVYEEPGGNAARLPDNSFGIESIDPFTGALKIVVTDLIIPMNGGLNLAVTRNYQSFQLQQGFQAPFRDYQVGRTTTGIGWDLHLPSAPGKNIVLSFTVSSPDESRYTDIVVNYTLQGGPFPNGSHAMSEGFVLKYGELSADGTIYNVSYGEGNATRQSNILKGLWYLTLRNTWQENHAEIDRGAARIGDR